MIWVLKQTTHTHGASQMKTETKSRTVELTGGQCAEMSLPGDVTAIYIEMNGKTYYLDDSTGEGIAECQSRSGQISWHEDDAGIGQLSLRWDDGREETTPHPVPITSSTSSDDIAAEFDYAWAWVEHDGDIIHVGIGAAE